MESEHFLAATFFKFMSVYLAEKFKSGTALIAKRKKELEEASKAEETRTPRTRRGSIVVKCILLWPLLY